MFAIGLVLFAVAFAVVMFCRFARSDPPDWADAAVGCSLIVGAGLMLISGLIKVVPYLWRNFL